MDEALHALLIADTAINARVSGRVFWGVAPQGEALPALVLTVVSGRDDPHLQGVDGLWRYRVQIDCYAVDRPAARLLSRDVIALLNGYTSGGGLTWFLRSGAWDDQGIWWDEAPFSAVAPADFGFNAVFLDTVRETFENAAVDRPTRISLDFNITWRT